MQHGETRSVYKFQLENTKGKRIGRPSRRMEDNIKSDRRKMGEGSDWIQMARDTVQLF
jgi:hypothetical protein